MNKSEPKNLLVNIDPLPLPSVFKKREQFFTKQIDFHAKGFKKFCKKSKKNLVEIKWPLPLHSRSKNGVVLRVSLRRKSRAERSLKVGKQ